MIKARTATGASYRREWFLFAAAAMLLVLARSFVPTYYESYFFDSDQAIVGLMARHLESGRGFPLYYYGLNYLLGVQAWIVAIFFALLRPSVAVLRLPLILLNVGVALSLMAIATRRLGIRPAVAFVAALPFMVPAPGAAAHLLEAAGASIEPFVYVLLLWLLRRRPLAFGIVFGIGVLHREFVAFALPALIAAEAATGELRDRENIRRALIAALVCAVLWLIVDDVKMHLAGGGLSLQLTSLGKQLCLGGSLGRRVASVARVGLPALYGGRPMPLQAWRIDSPLAPGHPITTWIVAAALALMVVRTARHWRLRLLTSSEAGFGPYLAGVGVLMACAYPLSCSVEYGAAPVLRYLMFALLVPIGIFLTYIVSEPSPRLRAVVAGAFAVWAAINGADQIGLMLATARTPPLAEHRVLTDYLLSHQIRFATANYWDAYVVTFLSRERVIVASNDVVRIPAYQKEVEAHAGDAVNLARQPCRGFATVASWCLQK